MKYKYEVDIYTDGACKGNPGPGGWAAVLLVKDPPAKKVIQGGQLQTTNNQMEIKAIIEGIKALKLPSKVNIYSDSNYVVQGATEWLDGWRKNNWKTSFKKPVKNVELWKELDNLLSTKGHDVTFYWIKAHNGHPENEEADSIASNQALNQ